MTSASLSFSRASSPRVRSALGELRSHAGGAPSLTFDSRLPLCLPGRQGKHAADLRLSKAAQAGGMYQESAEAGTLSTHSQPEGLQIQSL